MLIPFGCCAPEREHFLERIFTKLEGEKAKHILLRDRFRKITCNFVMTRNAPDHRGCTFGVRAFRVRDKKIDKNLRNQPECGQKKTWNLFLLLCEKHSYLSCCRGKEGVREWRTLLLSHSALYCPPLKSIGTDVSVAPEAFSHTRWQL